MKPFELVVLSGKGGTGKTSIAASLAALARNSVIADCDVDAADLHLILSPKTLSSERFFAGHIASVNPDLCIGCGICMTHCKFGAVFPQNAVKSPDAGNSGASCLDCDYCKRSCRARENALIQEMKDAMGEVQSTVFSIDTSACEGCGACVRFCPAKAISFEARDCGELMISETRLGPLSHARLEPGGENSGKLVSAVKANARKLSEERQLPLIIVDGPPGVGCPVIASISGASFVLLVSEPTLSAEHDLMRAIKLLKHFGVPGAVCVNKWDINPERTSAIEVAAAAQDILPFGRIRYDKGFSQAQFEAKTLLEMNSPAAADVQTLWTKLLRNDSFCKAAENH